MFASRMAGLRRELGLQERDRRLDRPLEQPGHQAEGVHVLRPGRVLAGQAELLDRLHRHAGQVQRYDVVAVELAGLQRVLVVPDPLQVAGGEVGGVDDQGGAARDVAQVRLEGRRVHRDQHIGRITRRQDVVVGEVELERRHSRQGSGWCPDLGGEVGQRRQVIAERCRFRCEPVPRELHPVAGVAGEADHHAVELLDLDGHCSVHLQVEAWVGLTASWATGRSPRQGDNPNISSPLEQNHAEAPVVHSLGHGVSGPDVRRVRRNPPVSHCAAARLRSAVRTGRVSSSSCDPPAGSSPWAVALFRRVLVGLLTAHADRMRRPGGTGGQRAESRQYGGRGAAASRHRRPQRPGPRRSTASGRPTRPRA